MTGPATDQRSPASRLREHVEHLALAIGERSVFRPGSLDASASYLESAWRLQGYRPVALPYTTRGWECRNLEVVLPGDDRPERILLVGAHYDSVRGCPGANDNATGVAALLELSRRFAELSTPVTLRFTAFVNEEPPFFYWRDMGSMIYARRARRRGDDIRLMISLETLGFYSEEPGSQRYPPLFRFFYPDRGNFVAFVSNIRSRRSMLRAVAAFRAVSDFPLEHVATFAAVPGVGWSDHLAFWRQGYPAFMITDTAPYRYPWYHTPGDTPDKVDHSALARLVDGLFGMLRRLAGEL